MFDPRLLVAAVAVIAASFLQAPLGRANADRKRHELRYSPNPDLAKLLALGNRSTAADALWLLSLPDISREFPDVKGKERWLTGVLETATELEPTFSTVYEYGANYLTLLDRRVRPDAPLRSRAEPSIAIVTKGAEAFRRMEDEDGRQYMARSALLRKLALIHYMDRKDEDTALRFLDMCVERPDCDILTRQMWSAMKSDRGGELIALAHWAELSEHANPDVAFEGRLQFARTRSAIARRAARSFGDQFGRPAESIEELSNARILAENVAAVVFADARIEDGLVVHDELRKLEQESYRLSLEWAAEIHRRDRGEWPTIEWLLGPENKLMRGTFEIDEKLHWAIDGEGRVRLVPVSVE